MGDLSKADAIRELLARFDAFELQDELANGAWVAVCSDTETGQTALHGPFMSPQDAQAFGDRHNENVNRGEPNPLPIIVTVAPLWPTPKDFG